MSSILSARQIWGAPVAIGLVSVIGLVAALLADDWGDVVSWVTLSVPVLVSLRGLRRKSRQPRTRPRSETGTT